MAARAMMETVFIVVILALTGVVLSADQKVQKEPSVEMKLHPAGGIKQGDDVTITCTAYGKGFLDVVRIVRSIGGEDFEINTNGAFSGGFKDIERYEAAEYTETEDGTGVVEMTIRDIQGEDGGNIGCKLLGKEEKGAYEDVVVDVPPKNVTLKYQDKDGVQHVVDADTPIQLEFGAETGIICETYVKGSDLEPAMDVFLDDKKITSRFSKDYESDNTHEQGIRTLYYHKTLTYLLEEPDVSEHGKTVKCTSSMPQFDPLTAEAKLEIIYAPNLDCATKYYSKIGDTNFRLTCRAGMNPEPTEFSFAWGKKPNRTTLYEGESADGFSVSKEVLEKNNEYEFIVTMDEVTDFHFRKYKLHVTNALGTSEISITLREEEETTSTTTTSTTTTTLNHSPTELEIQGKPDPDNSAQGLGKTGWTQLLLLAVIASVSWLISTV